MRGTLEQRFWAKVDKLGPILVRKLGRCWVWTAATDSSGYGHLRSSGHGQLVATHRLSWHFAYGEIPIGFCVLHKCDNPSCVRPSHLFLGTQKDNAKDREQKGRTNRHHPSPSAKTTEACVREIRSIYASGRVTQQSLCDQFNLGRTAVSDIVKRKTWMHVK